MSFHQLPWGTVFLNHVKILPPRLNTKVFISGGTEERPHTQVLVSPWGRREEGSEPAPKVGASLGSCATTSELQTDGCVLQHKPISSSTISYVFRLRLYLLLVYMIDDYRAILNTPFNFY